MDCLTEDGFVISREPDNFDNTKVSNKHFKVLTVHSIPNETIVLLRKHKSSTEESFIDVSHSSQTFEWLGSLQKAVNNGKSVTLYAQNDPFNGILGLVNCVRREPGGGNIKCIFVHDSNAPRFNPNENFYRMVVENGLAFNVYKEGKWGTYRNFSLNNNYRTITDNSFANFTVRGDLSCIAWIQGPKLNETDTDPSKELIHVCCSLLKK